MVSRQEFGKALESVKFFLLLWVTIVTGLGSSENAAAWVTKVTTIQPDCKIKASLPNNSYFGEGINIERPTKIRRSKFFENLNLTFICVSSNDRRVIDGMSFDHGKKKWSASLDAIISSNEGGNSVHWQYRWFRGNYSVIQLKSPNATGYAIIDRTQTDSGTIPSEIDFFAQRSGPIYLHFCILRPPKAVCGDGRMGYKQEGVKSDLIQYTLKILRNITFVDL